LYLCLIILLLLPFQTKALTDIESLSVVSHWTCDETSGVRYDSNTTNSNDLTDNNTVGYANGLRSNACDFEYSNNEYLSITDANQQGLEPTSFTVNLWVKHESKPSFYYVSKGISTSHGDGYSYMLGVGGDSPYPAYMFVTQQLLDNVGIDNATWYMLTFVFDSVNDVEKIYLNGAEAVSQANTSSITYGSGNFAIGTLASYANTGYFFDGLFDEITFDDTVWTASTTADVYNLGTPLPYTATSSDPTSTSTATSTSSTFEDDNIVFMLAIIVFLIASIWIGFVFNAIIKK